jgi:hypothetical protein
MLTLLHYLPHFIFAGVAVLGLTVMFADDGRKKRVFPQHVRQQHYRWDDHNPRRG